MRWAVVLLLLLPVSHAQPGIHNDPGPAETTLYVHTGSGYELVLNTQEPHPAPVVGGSPGVLTPTQTCADPPGFGAREHHSWYATATPGYVWFYEEDDGRLRYTPERGIARDLRLDASSPVRIVWYLEGDLMEDPSPLPAPEVVVRATLREGDEVGADGGPLQDGRLIAQDQTAPALLSGPATPDHPSVRYLPVEVDGETRHVYEFTLELPLAEPERGVQATARDGFHLRVDAFVENPACPDGQVMPNTVNLHSSHGHRPRLTLGVLDPLRVTLLEPVFVGDDLVIHVGVDSPWGNYDVLGDRPEEPPLTVAVEGPSTPNALGPAFFTSTPHNNDHHVMPLQQGWLWRYGEDGAADGLYTVRVTARNDQGTATATAAATFELGSGAVVACAAPDGVPRCIASAPRPVEESPGVGTGVGLVLLGVLVASRRRA